MGTGIHWTDETWNPVVGCTRVSAGCRHCYAFSLHNMRFRAYRDGKFPTAPQQYHQPFHVVQLMPDRIEQPLHWRKPRRVFVNSMSDLFHEDVPFDFIDRVFNVMIETPRHTYQVLTKRPERMREYVSNRAIRYNWHKDAHMPPRNIWLGVSVEDQAAADKRIPVLLDTRAAVRFLSCEPLLEAVDLSYWLGEEMPPLQWVIVGGESGPRYRPMELAWARSLRDQCTAAGSAFFFKQSSGPRPGIERELDGRMWEEMPA